MARSLSEAVTTPSWNLSSSDADDFSWSDVVKSTTLFSVIVLALIGNGLVVVAVASYRCLRSVTNQFVVSLAVADLTVAVLVMPVSALFELRAGQSHFTWQFCYFWISCDVTCCTASILHLCVIAVERYLAIAHPLSHGSRTGVMTRGRALLVIAGVWTCSAAISFAPIYAGWFADLTSMRLYSDTAADCGLHVNRVYAVVSSTTSFYLPLVVMLTVYSRIYRIARRQALEIHKLEVSLGVFDEPLPTDRDRRSSVSGRPARRSTSGVKDSKAIKTLGILMGMFCVCWCPFFLVYVIRPFCPSCVFPGVVMSAITWLGYSNSAVNPLVYALLNRDFRIAFERLLRCHWRAEISADQDGGRQTRVFVSGADQLECTSQL